ncbi:hypothetical protein PFISCL1PPCAC_9191, partial [Pristionchus fissidentatus]
QKSKNAAAAKSAKGVKYAAAVAAAAAPPHNYSTQYFSASSIERMAIFNMGAVIIFLLAALINILIYGFTSCKPCVPFTGTISPTVQYYVFYAFLFPSGIYLGSSLVIVSGICRNYCKKFIDIFLFFYYFTIIKFIDD